MGKAFIRQTEKMSREHKRKHRRRNVVIALAAVVVFGTAYALMLPAVTWDSGLVCGKKEHVHTEECYAEAERTLLCQTEEHTHGDDCYEEVTTYICGLEDDTTHIHTAECRHTEQVLTCTEEEHVHGENCYDMAPTKQLICTQEEHTHTNDCYDTSLEESQDYTCGIVAHKHAEECYFPDGSLCCTLCEHEHTAECQAEQADDAVELLEEKNPDDIWTRSPLGWVGKARAAYAADTAAVSGAKKGDIANISSVIPTAEKSLVGTYASDPATSSIEDQFFSMARDGQSPAVNDGKLLTDKSVIYKGDDYGAFDAYGEDTFGVTLSVLGQDYQMKEMDQVKIPVDVVFVLDVSGSMGNAAGNVTRREAVVNAVNTAMAQIMNDNPENRAGVVLYSSGGSALLGLDHYTAGNNGQYLIHSNNKIRTARNLNGVKSGTVAQTYGETGGFTQSHGTYTQYGIALGAQMLQNNGDTTYTATLRPGTSEERQVTVTRQPIMILLSDGDPTHCTSNYTDVLSGPAYGDGVYPSTTNNKGVQGYYTILSANYYKGAVGNHYDTPAMFYTIGMGINATGYQDMSRASSTGDCYKRAVLNPTWENVEDLLSDGARTTNPNNTYAYRAEVTWPISCQMLNQLLGNTYRQRTVTVGSTGSYREAIGSTSANVPVIANPYSGNYSYADGAYFGNLSTSDLQEIFDNIISGNLNIKRFGFMLSKNTRAVVTDEIGEGMEIKGAPKLRYNGVYYSLEQVGSGDHITYVCRETAVTSDGSQRTADLSQIRISVTTENGKQTVSMELPDTVIPTYTPSFSEDWYYEELPVRLIYQVGLSEEAKSDIESLQPGETLTYYTNAWRNTSAVSTHKPHQDDPYYYNVRYDDGTSRTRQYKDYSADKTDNATATAGTSVVSTERSDVIRVNLGNNGKLVFRNTAPTVVSMKLRKVDMMGNTITDCAAEFELYGDKELTEKIGTYATVDGVVTIPNLKINTTYYLKETRAPDGYYPMPEAKAFTVDAKGNATGIDGDVYLNWADGELIVRNPNDYELPQTGGMGAYLFLCFGALLMAAPIAYGCSMRRKRERGNGE